MRALLLYLFITCIGYFIGAFLKKKGIALAWTGVIQTAAITCLVFVMGVRIGADSSIVNSLDAIGLTAFVITLFAVAGSVAAVFITRKCLGFDREGFIKNKEPDNAHDTGEIGETVTETAETEEAKGRPDNIMTWCIVGAVAAGIAAGLLIMPDWFVAASGDIITVGLCVLLFFRGNRHRNGRDHSRQLQKGGMEDRSVSLRRNGGDSGSFSLSLSSASHKRKGRSLRGGGIRMVFPCSGHAGGVFGPYKRCFVYA